MHVKFDGLGKTGAIDLKQWPRARSGGMTTQLIGSGYSCAFDMGIDLYARYEGLNDTARTRIGKGLRIFQEGAFFGLLRITEESHYLP
jgi:hypothetical protein